MFEVSEKASEMVKEHLKEKEDAPSIRIMVSGAGCSGPSLGMALDEPKETDEVFENDGVNYIIDKKLYGMIKPVHVDYITKGTGSGFVISFNPSAAGSCSSCGGSCA